VIGALLGGYGPCFVGFIMANRNDSTERDPEQGTPRELEDQDLGAGDERGQPGGPGWDKNIGPMGIAGQKRDTTIKVPLSDENDTSEEDEPGEHEAAGAP
jgi:hypothetical protein